MVDFLKSGRAPMTSHSQVAAFFNFNTQLSVWTRRRFIVGRAKLAGDAWGRTASTSQLQPP